MTEVDARIQQAANDFASRLMSTLAGVLPDGVPNAFATKLAARPGEVRIGVSPVEPLGLPLTVGGREVFRLIATYECTASPVSEFLSVVHSTFKVNVDSSNVPLFSLDYVRDSGSSIPSAHYNIHGKRKDMTNALLRAGARQRGKGRAKRIARGIVPKMADLHFPVGGDRFRPCLEDVLEMMVLEFGIDAQGDARAHLAKGRRDWRRMQLAAAVSDDPATAAAELARLGYRFLWKPRRLHARPDRTDAL